MISLVLQMVYKYQKEISGDLRRSVLRVLLTPQRVHDACQLAAAALAKDGPDVLKKANAHLMEIALMQYRELYGFSAAAALMPSCRQDLLVRSSVVALKDLAYRDDDQGTPFMNEIEGLRGFLIPVFGSRDEASDLSRFEMRERIPVFSFGGTTYMHVGAAGRVSNVCSNPAARLVASAVGHGVMETRVTLVRDVHRGEEITIKFNQDMDNDPDCMCNSCEKHGTNGWATKAQDGDPELETEENLEAQEVVNNLLLNSKSLATSMNVFSYRSLTPYTTPNSSRQRLDHVHLIPGRRIKTCADCRLRIAFVSKGNLCRSCRQKAAVMRPKDSIPYRYGLTLLEIPHDGRTGPLKKEGFNIKAASRFLEWLQSYFRTWDAYPQPVLFLSVEDQERLEALSWECERRYNGCEPMTKYCTGLREEIDEASTIEKIKRHTGSMGMIYWIVDVPMLSKNQLEADDIPHFRTQLIESYSWLLLHKGNQVVPCFHSRSICQLTMLTLARPSYSLPFGNLLANAPNHLSSRTS